MRQSAKAFRADCNAEFRFTALTSAQSAITDTAHERPVFSKEDVYARMGNVDHFTRRAVTSLLERIIRAGAVRPEGKDRWQVIDEESLCDVVYSHAA
jgi:hypothetical protein